MLTNQQIADDFSNGIAHGKANSMFIEYENGLNIIYSYGYHFPIAVTVSITREPSFAYFNSDKYSVTTSRQQGMVRRTLESKGVRITPKTTDELIAMIQKRSVFNSL